MKYIRWKEPVYLLTLPVLERVQVCYDCGATEWRWEKKGFIKIKEIEHKRKRTPMDDVMDATHKYMSKRLLSFLDHESLYKGGKLNIPKTIKMK